MLKFVLAILALSFVFFSCSTTIEEQGGIDNQTVLELTADDVIAHYFEDEISDKMVVVEAVVVKCLKDDLEGSAHQKFIVELQSGQTLLVAHNIDLADRINTLQEGDLVLIKGEYEWSDKGGVIHWTHHDPANIHEGGWIEHSGIRYE